MPASETCPRSTVARLIAERLGHEIDHIRAPAERVQPRLFNENDE